MKLLRYEHSADTHLGVLTETGIAPLDGLSGRYPTMQSVAAGGPAALETVRRQVDSEPTRVPLEAVRLLKAGTHRTVSELWSAVSDEELTEHHSQMDVVLALWKNGLIV